MTVEVLFQQTTRFLSVISGFHDKYFFLSTVITILLIIINVRSVKIGFREILTLRETFLENLKVLDENEEL